jgi:hypothetical protein
MTRALDLAEVGSAYAAAIPFSFRNKIINGAMDIWQRGTSFTFTGTSWGYTADRWLFGYASGSNVTVSQVAYTGSATVPRPNGLAIRTVGAASTVGGALIQRIEDVTQFAGGTLTVSFYAKAAGSMALGLYLNQNFGTGGSTMVTVSGPARALSAASDFTRYTATFTVPAISGKTIGTGHSLEIAISFPTTAFDIQITNVQVEGSGQVTPFEQRPIGLELSLCQRYYEKSLPGVGEPVALICTRVDMLVANVSFKATKRSSTPTLTVYSPATLTTGKVRALDGSQAGTDVTATVNGHPDGIAYFAGAFIVGAHYNAAWTADAEL